MKEFLKKNKYYIVAFVLLIACIVIASMCHNADAANALTLAAFVPCSSALAGNLASDCDNPRIAGYEQIGVIFNRADVDWANLAVSASNPRIIEAIAASAGKKPYALYNNKNNPLPFDGTNTTYNSDTDQYDKTLQFYYEGIGGGVSADVVEPLKGGEYIAILQRKDHRGDGSFQVFGYQSGLKANAQVQDETTGYWLMTMACSEPSAEVSFFDTDYATTKAAFDALVALC